MMLPALFVLLAVAFAATGAAAADEGEVPAGGEVVMAPSPGDLFAVGDLSVESIEADGVERAARITLDRPPAQPWEAQVTAATTAPVSKGDVLLAEFFVRGKADLGAEAAIEFVFERRAEPWEKSVERSITAGPGEWTRVLIPLRANADFEVEGAQVAIRVGYQAQTLELAGLRVLNFGDSVQPEDLPSTTVAYDGVEPDAAWRAEAAERIDRLRKADLTVRVVDRAGRPVEGARVQVEMTRHAFDFGTAVGHGILFDESSDGERYREILTTWFNYATPENALKQNVVEERGIDRGLEMVDWLNARGLRVRGHNLLWPGMHEWFLPERIRIGHAERAAVNEQHAAEWMAAELRAHLAAKAIATRGRVVGWDVANEVANNREIMEILGDSGDSDAALIGWFELLREIDPRAEAYLNDYGIMVGSGMNRRLIDRYLRQAQNLIDAGQAPDAIGVQCHFGSNLTGPRRAWELLDELHATGVPVQVTEFDVITGDAALDGQFARDFMTACFAHEGVNGFVVWGFWEGRHWRPASAMFRRDWSVRPTGEAWRDLVLSEWWTREVVTTDTTGTATLRGFRGDYRVRVGDAQVVAHLPAGGREIVVEVDVGGD